MSRRLVVLGLVVVVVLATGGYAVAQGRDASPAYRTATARNGDVDRTMNLTGTVAASGRRDLSFGTSGTVASVRARAGQHVTAGQSLGTLDPTALDAAVTRARANVAKAEAQLESDEDSQAEAVSASASPAGSPATGRGNGSGNNPGNGSGTSTTKPKGSAGTTPKAGGGAATALAELQEQQRAVRDAQSKATEAITGARAALEAQGKACAVDKSQPTGDGATDSKDPSDEPSTDPTPTPDPTPDPTLPAKCTDALAAVQRAQDVVADKQDALQSALAALGQTLTKATAALQAQQDQQQAQQPQQTGGQGSGQGSGQGTGQATPTKQPSQAAQPAQSGTGSSATRGASSAGSIASDQAAIDTAEAALTEAKAAREAATLTAPYAGRVLAVDVSRGGSVGDSDVAFVLVGDGGTTVTTQVTVAQVPQIHRGQRAQVTPAGWDQPLTGTVTAIGMLPVTSGSGSGSGSDPASYPVTLTLDTAASVPEGSTASVALVTGSAGNVVTVPTSAVHTLGRTTVTVLSGGKATPTVVTVGVVGPSQTQIRSGLKAGQRVVVADLDEALPSGDSQQGGLGRTGGLRGTGGFGEGPQFVTRSRG